MADRVVYPPDWWIRAYLDGRASVLFLPMKPQPFQWAWKVEVVDAQ